MFGENDDAEAILRRDYAGRKVLVVEDDPLNAEVMAALLGDIDWQVELARNGREALACVRRERYDIILMDLKMPEMDGLEATRLIRQMPAMRSIPVIAITANIFRSDRESCLDAGASDYLTKPLDLPKFYATLLKWQGDQGDPGYEGDPGLQLA